MNRYTCITALLLLSLIIIQPAIADDSGSLFVQVQAAKLRAAPRQWAAGVADIRFGDKLTVISKDSDWVKVQAIGGTEGYIHESAVTTKKIVLSTQQVSLADVAVDESQVYLAGKGFNDDVEKSFKKGSGKSDFNTVDKAQKSSSLLDSNLAAFIHTGKLREE